MDGVHLQEWHMSLWILFAAFVWTAAYLVRSRGHSTLLVLAPVGALALSPYAAYITSTGYADVAVACFVATGALAIGLWLDGGRVEYALLGALLLAGGANTKNEGQTAAIAILIAALVLLRIGRDQRWHQWLVATAIVVAGAAPWLAYRAGKGFGNDDVLPLHQSLDVGFLTGRLDRLGSATTELLQQVAYQDRWLWVVPAFLGLAIVCIATRAMRRQAAFYAIAGVLMMLPVLWAYWTGKPAIDSWLLHSANRTVIPFVFTCGVGTIHLVAPLLRRP
jgi:4-amino-4-deoxy-L-arabinose transferase-like glycosyltransferase